MYALTVLVFSTFLLCFSPSVESYTSQVLDNIDFEEILRSDRLLNNYMNCFLDITGCTPDAREIKRIIPDALETDCSQCNEPQKKGTKMIIRHLMNNKADMWEQLMAKYDPNGDLRKYHGDIWLKD